MDHTLRAEKLERTTWVLRNHSKPGVFLGTEIFLFKPFDFFFFSFLKSQESSPRQVTGNSSQLGLETGHGEGNVFIRCSSQDCH